MDIRVFFSFHGLEIKNSMWGHHDVKKNMYLFFLNNIFFFSLYNYICTRRKTWKKKKKSDTKIK